MELRFVVDEGDKYAFGSVTAESRLTGADASKLVSQSGLESGAVYNQDLVEKSKEKLTLALVDQGQPFARVRAVPVRDPTARTVGIKYMIEDGPHIYLERIDIVGNTKTKDYVIRRELGIAEGDAVNVLLLDRARTRIKALGLFKGVELKQKKGSAEDKLLLTVAVVEDETIDLALSNVTGAGAGLGSPNHAEVKITENDVVAPTTNPIDDATFFVRQHYLDFLNREPDPAGLAFVGKEGGIGQHDIQGV